MAHADYEELGVFLDYGDDDGVDDGDQDVADHGTENHS